MEFKYFVTILMFYCVLDGYLCKQIPDYINICKRDPATINDCARRSIESLRPQLINGIPELDVPGMDPFYIEEIVTLSPNQSPVRATGRDIQATGTGNFTIKSLSVDLDTFTIRARVRFPRIHLDGRFKINSQLVVLPLNGEGTLSADAVKCDADMVLHTDIKERDGAEYLEFTKLDMDINIKDYKIKLNGLFNGDKVLGEAANRAINENRGEFLKSAKPYLESTVSNLLLNIANRIVKDLTLDQLLPKP